MRGWDEWLVTGFKAQRKKIKTKRKIKKKERMLGLDSNEGKREGKKCEWWNWALSIGEYMNFEGLNTNEAYM